jgi:hypothetical protein
MYFLEFGRFVDQVLARQACSEGRVIPISSKLEIELHRSPSSACYFVRVIPFFERRRMDPKPMSEARATINVPTSTTVIARLESPE